MFGKFKETVQDWACDVDGLNNRKQEAMEYIIPYLANIDDIWEKSNEKEKHVSNLIEIKSKIFAISGNAKVLYLLDSDNRINAEEIIPDASSEVLSMVKDLLDRYYCLRSMSGILRKQVYAEKSEEIYNNLLVINALLKKYLDISSFLGEPEDIDAKIGKNGSKLKSYDAQAFAFIDMMLERLVIYRNEQSFINARNISKDAKHF